MSGRSSQYESDFPSMFYSKKLCLISPLLTQGRKASMCTSQYLMALLVKHLLILGAEPLRIEMLSKEQKRKDLSCGKS